MVPRAMGVSWLHRVADVEAAFDRLTPPGGGFGPPSAPTWRLHGNEGSMDACPGSG